MKKTYALIFGLIFVLIMSSCATSSEQVESAVKATVEAQKMVIPTFTSIPPTRLPTSTRTITQTPLPTETPISPKEMTATQELKMYTATAIARTKVSEEKRATATKIASYQGIYVKDISTYPDHHIGEKIKMYIVIFNIMSDTELQGWMNGTYEDLYVVMAEPFDDLYENHAITVYGTVDGEHCGTNVYGAEVCSPIIVDSFYTK